MDHVQDAVGYVIILIFVDISVRMCHQVMKQSKWLKKRQGVHMIRNIHATLKK